MNGEATEAGSSEAAQALGALHDGLRECLGCGLHTGRTQVVFGVGDPEAALMFVGEGPGFHEDKQGEPFVGQAGKLLTELLGAIGLSRGDVYIANVVKCRPPENRDPAPDEIEACSPHLMEQIAIIRPKVICTLGRFATKLLAETDLSMTAIHGKAKEKELAGVNTIIFPVFHPAAALYAPANRQLLQDDFAKLRRLLDRGLAAVCAGPRAEEGVAEAEVAGAKVADAVAVAEPDLAVLQPGVEVRQGLPRPAAPRVEQLPLW
jgi:uracil-DNA glycosylase family 4